MTEIATLPKLTCQGFDLDLSPDKFGWLESSIHLMDDVPALRQRMSRDGYLFMPGLLDRRQVIEARRGITNRFAAEGHLDPDFPAFDAIPRPHAPLGFHPDILTGNEALRKVLYEGEMMAFFDHFFGEPALHFDFTWFRAVMPKSGTPSHCDSPYMGRGETERLFTAWTPMGDVSLDPGGLIILEGSNNNLRLKETYGRSDVDAYCENRPGQRDGWAKGRGGQLGKNPLQIQRSVGGRWLTCPDYRMGDVLIFSIFTVHASLDNHSNQVRFSADTRYQPASGLIDDRWMGADPPAHGKAGKRGRVC